MQFLNTVVILILAFHSHVSIFSNSQNKFMYYYFSTVKNMHFQAIAYKMFVQMMLSLILYVFFNLRCGCSLAKALPVDQRPRCYPYWEEDDTSMPLPFDLSRIVTNLENLM